MAAITPMAATSRIYSKTYCRTRRGYSLRCYVPSYDVAELVSDSGLVKAAIDAAAGVSVASEKLRLGSNKNGAFLSAEIELDADEFVERLKAAGWTKGGDLW